MKKPPIIQNAASYFRALALALILAGILIFPIVYAGNSQAIIVAQKSHSAGFTGEWGRLSLAAGGASVELMAAEVSELNSISQSVALSQAGRGNAIAFLYAAVALCLAFLLRNARLEWRHAAPLSVILIVVMIPAYVSDAFATSITPVKISGGDGVVIDQFQGFKRKLDNLTIKVSAEIDNDSSISNQQVKFVYGGQGSGYNGTCTSGGDCTYIQLNSNLVGNNSYIANLYADNGTHLAKSEFMYIVTDQKPPSVSISADRAKIGAGGNVTINWTASDPADDSIPCGVGISAVKLFAADFAGDILDEATGSGACSMNGSYTAESNGTGSYRICIAAWDRFNQSSFDTSNCVSYEEDSDAPNASHMEVLNPSGEANLTYMGPNNKSFLLNIYIAGDIDPSTFKADLSSFGLGNSTSMQHTEINSTWHRFSYSGVANVNQSFTPSVTVNGTDSIGNPLSGGTLTAAQINFDSTGPIFSSITSEGAQTLNGIIVLKDSMKFTASISDTFLYNGEIYLDISPENGATLTERADECNGSTSGWTCNWSISGLKSLGEGYFNISGNLKKSKDDFGNIANSTVVLNATADWTPPKIVNSTVNVAHANADLYGNDTIQGDKAEIIIYVKEPGSVLYSMADLSEASSNQTNVTGNCSADGNTTGLYKCYWATERLDGSGSVTMNFNFSDELGNYVIHTEGLDIVPLLNYTNPNYWKIKSVTCSPSLIDRQVTTLSIQRVYCSVVLEPRSSSTKMLAISMGQCYSTTLDLGSWVRSVTYLELANKKTPWLRVELQAKNMTIDSIPVTCPLEIYSRISAGVLANPELQNASFEIKFYNNPLGTMPANLQEEIQNAYDEANQDLLEWVSVLKKIVWLLEKICGLWGVWQNLSNAWLLMSITMANSANVLQTNPVTAPAGAALKKTAAAQCIGVNRFKVEIEAKGYQKTISKFCGWINCKYTGLEDQQDQSWLGKWNQWGYQAIDDYWTFGATDSNFLKIVGGEGYKVAETLNIKDNIILSLITGCIPGIIYGIEKYRQILCMYAYCLNSTAAAGFDAAMCSELKGYAQCMFIYGEIMYALPWVGIVAVWLEKLSAVLSNPLAIIGVTISYACQAWCNAATPTMYKVCKAYDIITMLSAAWSELANVIEYDDLNVEVDWCEMMEDGDDSFLDIF